MSAAGRVARSWFTSRSVAKAVGGEVLQGGPTGRGVATDTRADCDGMVFVALRGERHDSHDHLGEARAVPARRVRQRERGTARAHRPHARKRPDENPISTIQNLKQTDAFGNFFLIPKCFLGHLFSYSNPSY